MIRRFFEKLKSGTEELNYGRDIIAAWGGALRPARPGPVRLLDIGCGRGYDLFNVRRALAAQNVDAALYGIENHRPYVAECEAAGVAVSAVDIERDPYPFDDGFFDGVIANQVLEHTKELFWIFGEAARIVRPGGYFLVGVPNLASLHNRVLLLAGRQPTAQQSLSAHVRGFTRPDLRRFAEAGGFFEARDAKGSNFYPFGPRLSRPLARFFPGMAWGLFLLLRRTEKKGNFLKYLYDNPLETPFYGGPLNPVEGVRVS